MSRKKMAKYVFFHNNFQFLHAISLPEITEFNSPSGHIPIIHSNDI